MQEILLTIVKSINWGEVLTSLLSACMYLLVPVFLELTTGVLRSTSAYLEANKENSWALRLMSDVATVMNAQWQIEAKDIREKWDKGELTIEEWEKEKADLKEGFHVKMREKLKQYPVAYAKKLEANMDDHMEAWIAKNKRIEALLTSLKDKTTMSDPALLAELKAQLESQIKDNQPTPQ